MLYNLLDYLRKSLTTITFVAEGFNPESKDASILVTETGGYDNIHNWRSRRTFQFISRSFEQFESKNNIEIVYEKLVKRHRFSLDSVDVGGKIFSGMMVYFIEPMQRPGYLGVDENGYNSYSFNISAILDYLQ